MSKADKKTKKEKGEDPNPINSPDPDPIKPDGQGPIKPNTQGPVDPDDQENRAAKPVENLSKKRELATEKVEQITKKVEEKVKGKEGKIWDQELGKLDNPTWLNKPTFFAAGVFSFIFGLWASPDSGISQGELNQALSDQQRTHTTAMTNLQTSHAAAIQAKNAEISGYQNQLTAAQSRNVIKLSKPFRPWTTAMLQTTPAGERVITTPFEYFATKDFPRRSHVFNEISAAAPYTIDIKELHAFDANNAWEDKETGMYPHKIVVIPTNLMGTAAEISALNEGLNAVESDLRTYAAQPDLSIAYRFKKLAGRVAGPNQVAIPERIEVTRDLEADKTPNSGNNDMRVIATIDLQ